MNVFRIYTEDTRFPRIACCVLKSLAQIKKFKSNIRSRCLKYSARNSSSEQTRTFFNRSSVVLGTMLNLWVSRHCWKCADSPEDEFLD
jgi:hypothetical protein